jgi:hypothetical protein
MHEQHLRQETLFSNTSLRKLNIDKDLESMLYHAKEVILENQRPITLLYDADFDGMGSAAIFQLIANHLGLPVRKMAMTYEKTHEAIKLINGSKRNIVCVDYEPHGEIHSWLEKPNIQNVIIFGHHPTRKDLLELDANRSEVQYYNPLTETSRSNKISNSYVLAHLASLMGVRNFDNALFSAVFCARGYGFSEDAKRLREQAGIPIKIKGDLIDRIRLLHNYRINQCNAIVNALTKSSTCYNPKSPIVKLGKRVNHWDLFRIREKEIAWSLAHKKTIKGVNLYQVRRFDVPNVIFNRLWTKDRAKGKPYSVFYSVSHKPATDGSNWHEVTKISLRGKINVSDIVERVGNRHGIGNKGGHDFSAGMIIEGHRSNILEELCHG